MAYRKNRRRRMKKSISDILTSLGFFYICKHEYFNACAQLTLSTEPMGRLEQLKFNNSVAVLPSFLTSRDSFFQAVEMLSF
jgi:hypothetical protein